MLANLDHVKGEAVVPIIEKYLDIIETKRIGTVNKREMIEQERAQWESIEHEYMNMVNDPFKLQSFPKLSSQLELPKSESLIVIPGREHHGKSTLFRQIAIDMALSNPDIIILYYSLDDSKRLSTPGFIGAISHVRMRSVRHLNDDSINQEEKKLIIDSFNKIKSLTNFKLKDASNVNCIADIRKDVLMYRSLYGNKKINIFIDALNDLRDCANGDRRTATEDAVNKLKNMTVRYDCNIWLTAHLKKQSGRPTNDDIKETGGIAYMADLILLVYNALLAEGVSTILKETAPVGRAYEFYPIMDINISKNKVTEARGRKLLIMHSDEGWFEEIPTTKEEELLKTIEAMHSKDGQLRVFSGFNIPKIDNDKLGF
jgi:hypothetical protein